MAESSKATVAADAAVACGIDWSTALEGVEGNRSLLVELVEVFLMEQADLVRNIERALDEQKSVDLQRAAHTLKGCLRYFGDTEAGRTSRAIEERGKQGDMTAAAPMFVSLRAQLDELLPLLRHWADENRVA